MFLAIQHLFHNLVCLRRTVCSGYIGSSISSCPLGMRKGVETINA